MIRNLRLPGRRAVPDAADVNRFLFRGIAEYRATTRAPLIAELS